MRLLDLEPHWVSAAWCPPSAKLGVRYLCPCCRQIRLANFLKNPICGNDAIDLQRLFEARDCDHPDFQKWLADTHIGSTLWQRSGDTFETLTLTPSVDASKFGHWHGFITNGEMS